MKAQEIPILMYHEIGEQKNPWCVSLQSFKEQMQWLKEKGWESLSLSELKDKILQESSLEKEEKIEEEKEEKEIGEKEEKIETQKESQKQEGTEGKYFVLTFDDGRKGVHRYALPLLQKLGFTATIFVVPQWIEKTEKKIPGTAYYGEEIPSEEQYSDFLTWNEIKELSRQGFEIGSHSFSHKDLTRLPASQFLQELQSAEEFLEKKISKKVQHFCYPYGKYSSEIAEEIGKRYTTAVSVQKGFAKISGAYARQWVLRDTPLENFQKLLQRPKISLCMIVKNEERFLDTCLSSVQGLVDEIIIVDTGSTDNTKEIAQRHHVKLFDFTWNDDFSSARNFSLQQATGDWIFILDADEELVQEEHQVILEAVNNWTTEGFRILTKNYSNDSTAQGWLLDSGARSRGLQGWFPSIKVRLFQNQRGILFKGKVHEVIPENSFKNMASLPLAIHHYGALRGDLKEKTEMHLRLTQQKIADAKNTSLPSELAKSYFELGVQYKNLGNFAEAETAFRQSLALDNAQISPFINLALVVQKQGKLEEAQEIYQKALEKSTDKKSEKKSSVSAEAHFGLGYCFFVQNHLEKAAQHFAQAIVIFPQFIEAYVNLAAVRERQGKLQEAFALLQKVLTIMPQHARAQYNLGVVLEKVGTLEALKGAMKSYRKAVELGYAKKEEVLKRVQEMERFLEKERTR